MNYLKDRFGKACLSLAERSKGKMKFGAVLVRNSDDCILGKGWNRQATDADRKALSHVDYAIHAEQAAILNAITWGCNIQDARLYVLGYCKTTEYLSIRDGKYFTCRKCPHTLIKYKVPVYIPTAGGWEKLSPEEALASAKQHIGHWNKFIKSIPR